MSKVLLALAAAAAATTQPNCEDLWGKAGVQSSASFVFGGVKGQGIIGTSQTNKLKPYLTYGTSYTMEMTASSTCPEEFVVGLQGGGGWMFTVVPTSWQGTRTMVETSTNVWPQNQASLMTVRSSLKAAMSCRTVNRGGDRRLGEDEEDRALSEDEDPRRELGDNSETVCNLDFPRCNVWIQDIKLYATSCYDTTAAPTKAPTNAPTDKPTAQPSYTTSPTVSPTVAPTDEPTPKPTPTTTTQVVPPLPPVPVRYFATLFDCVIGPVIPAIKNEETPVQVRYTALIDSMTWNCMAIYSPTWKDALTKQRPFMTAPSSKHDTENRIQCAIAAAHHFTSVYLTESRAGIEAAVESVSANYLGYTIPLQEELYPPLEACGLNPRRQRRGKLDAFVDPDSATDQACLAAAVAGAGYDPSIVGQAVAEQIFGFGARDGWNSLGDLDRDGDDCTANQRPFRDTTSYSPFAGAPGGSAQDPATWTRWQALEEDTDEGFFFFQEHVTPHIGTKAKMRVISDADRAARTAPAPNYDYPAEANLAIQRVSALTDRLKAEVEWYDDKLNVLITIFGTLMHTQKFKSFEHGCAYLVGYTNSEYDATVVVWKEKRAHDLIRPTSWIQENFKDDEFLSYAGPYEGIQTIRGKDWVPYKRVMPHSEYPSGSACICKSIQQFTDAFMLRSHGEASIGISATFPAGSSYVEPGFTPAADVPLSYATMTDMANTCGRSRIDGGMHFTKSVPAAEALCDGIGDAGFAFATVLMDDDW